MDQCLNVDQSVVSVAKEIRERINEEGGRGRIKGTASEFEWLNQPSSSVSSFGCFLDFCKVSRTQTFW